jgi:hypothetical protein
MTHLNNFVSTRASAKRQVTIKSVSDFGSFSLPEGFETTGFLTANQQPELTYPQK